MSKIRVSEIRVSEIRVSEIRISSNHHELHGAIFLQIKKVHCDQGTLHFQFRTKFYNSYYDNFQTAASLALG